MTEKALLLRQLHQAFDQQSWHGPNLYGSIRGLQLDTAAWRPTPDRHNIWELIVHAAYWKYTVVRRITGEKRGSFALEGSNFFVRPYEHSSASLKADIKLLKRSHKRIIETLEAMKPSDLDKIPMNSRVPNRDVILGIAAHDIYHAGQIQLLKRLFVGRKNEE